MSHIVQYNRARPVKVQEMFIRKLTKNKTYLEILVSYLDNPPGDAIFESNQIKEQHETMKTLKTLIMN